MDYYKYEQSNEIEVLESIFSEELKFISKEPYIFDIVVKSSNDASNKEDKIALELTLRFTMQETYPDVPPLFEIEHSVDELTPYRVDVLLSRLKQQTEENLGIVMIYGLVVDVQETLLGFVDDIKWERDEKKREQELEQRRLDEIKYKGTTVTLESFLAWKIKFDEEMRSVGKRRVETSEKHKKLTGRQLFERDHTLNDSDVMFLTDKGVKVDESLFQDLDDLELDDEFDE